MRALILGRGNMGRAIRDALAARGDEVVAIFGRTGGDARPDTVHARAGRRRLRVQPRRRRPAERPLRARDRLPGDRARNHGLGRCAVGGHGLVEGAGATLVDAPTFSVGTVLFGDLAEQAARVFGRLEGYDPYVMEWHRRAKADRPSGTAARNREPHAAPPSAQVPRTAGGGNDRSGARHSGDRIPPRRRIAGHARRGLRCHRRVDRVADHGARSVGVRRRGAARVRLAPIHA